MRRQTRPNILIIVLFVGFLIVAWIVSRTNSTSPKVATQPPQIGKSIGPTYTNIATSPVYIFKLSTKNYYKKCGNPIYRKGNTVYFKRCKVIVKFITNLYHKVVPTLIPTTRPQPTIKPFPTIAPSPTAAAYGTLCDQGNQTACVNGLANLINRERATHGVAPLSLNTIQSSGTANCPGAYGHSLHMSQTGQLAHDQFPADICVSINTAGENIGVASGDEWGAIKQIFDLMLQEPWTSGCSDNHHCNFDYAAYHQMGIGIVVSGGNVWQTEDFLG